MPNFLKVSGVALLTLFLNGCEKQDTYQYLITHPEILSKKIEACAAISLNATREEIQQCKTVIVASSQFAAALNEQQANAEKFGMRLLALETEYANVKDKLRQAEIKLQQLKVKGVTAASIQAVEVTVVSAKKSCQEKLLEINMLLAVAGLSAPD